MQATELSVNPVRSPYRVRTGTEVACCDSGHAFLFRTGRIHLHATGDTRFRGGRTATRKAPHMIKLDADNGPGLANFLGRRMPAAAPGSPAATGSLARELTAAVPRSQESQTRSPDTAEGGDGYRRPIVAEIFHRPAAEHRARRGMHLPGRKKGLGSERGLATPSPDGKGEKSRPLRRRSCRAILKQC